MDVLDIFYNHIIKEAATGRNVVINKEDSEFPNPLFDT